MLGVEGGDRGTQTLGCDSGENESRALERAKRINNARLRLPSQQRGVLPNALTGFAAQTHKLISPTLRERRGEQTVKILLLKDLYRAR